MQFSVLHSLGDTLTTDSLPDLLPPDKLREIAVEGETEERIESGSMAEAVITEQERLLSSTSKRELPDIARRVHEMIEADEPDMFRNIIDDAEQLIIEEVLNHFHGNQVQASRVLGISRTTLRGKLSKVRS